MKNKEKLFYQIYRKYALIKLRLKIGFIAFEKGISIKELFF